MSTVSETGARRLLLVSNSTLHGGGYLDHCEARMRAALAGVRRVLFVPFAIHDRDRYAASARERLGRMGFGVDSLHEAGDDPAAARRMVEAAEAVFAGGGNTFRLLAKLYRLDLLAALSHTADLSVGCYCEDESRCHRSVLRELLKERGARVS